VNRAPLTQVNSAPLTQVIGVTLTQVIGVTLTQVVGVTLTQVIGVTLTQVIGVTLPLLVGLRVYIAVGLRLGKRVTCGLTNASFTPPLHYKEFHPKYPSKLQTLCVSATKGSAILQDSFIIMSHGTRINTDFGGWTRILFFIIGSMTST